MDKTLMIYPMFTLVVLTILVAATLYRTRVASVMNGKVKSSHFQLFNSDQTEPDRNLALTRHLSNLFEMPVLFYVACLAVMITDTASPLILGLAWGYVAARLVHAYIHTGKNRLRARIRAFFASLAFLIALWTALVITIAAA